ncbi:MAG: carotenoid oxygenase family protein [Pyrinomonadaceae bacterium]
MMISRREFSRYLIGAAAVGLVDISVFSQLTGDPAKSIRRLATATASGNGAWGDLRIEGKLPRDLNGTLFRTAPGESERFGVRLMHLFDGDAYVAGWEFRDGKASLRGRYIQSSGRVEERKAGKMLYNEYGTHAPDSSRGSKNQPSVNIVEWNGKLLGLSEGSLPSIIDPRTFDLKGYESFGGVVPGHLTFTAHPRFDPTTGDMYAFGLEKRPPGTLNVVHVEKTSGKASIIYKIPQRGFNMIHDAMLTENFFIVIVHPQSYDVEAMMSGKTMGEILRYDPKAPSILYAMPRSNADGKARFITVELPPALVYHYGNAYEPEPGKIAFEMIAYNDAKTFEFLRNWRSDRQMEFVRPRVKQTVVDLENRKHSAVEDLYEGAEFPRYDMRLTGKRARYLYVADRLYEEDAAIVRIDTRKRSSIKFNAGKERTLAEPVFVPKGEGKQSEDNGWLLIQGYDAARNENFLEIRDAQTLGFQARIWAAGQHFPLGFHGNFVSSTT